MGDTTRAGAAPTGAAGGQRRPDRVLLDGADPVADRRGEGNIALAGERPVSERGIGSTDRSTAFATAATDPTGEVGALRRRIEELTRENDRLRARLREEPAPSPPVRFRRPISPIGRLRPRAAASSDVLWTVLVGLAGIAGALVVLVATSRFGPFISPDSLHYLAGARDLLEDGDLEDLRLSIPPGWDYFMWPPFFPAAIALVGLGPGDLPDAARFVNAAAFGGTVVVAAWWLRRIGVARRWLALGSLATLLSFPLFFVSLWAWSEAVFSFWLLLFATLLARYVEARGRRVLFAVAACASLVWLSRYIGAFVVVLGLGTVVLRNRAAPRRALADGVVFAAVAAIPSALWLLRNQVVTGSWVGPRSPSDRALDANVRLVLETLGGWIIPGWVPAGWGPWLAAAATIALLCGVGWLVLAPHAQAAGKRDPRPDVAILFAVVAGYVVYLVGSASRVAFDPIDTRLLAPIAVPVLLLIVAVADRVDRSLRKVRRGWLPRTLMLAGAAGWLLVPATDIRDVVDLSRAYGGHGYGSIGFRDAEVLASLGRTPPDGQFVSNYPEVLAYHNQLPADYSPIRGAANDLPALADAARQAPTYLVWFAIPGTEERGYVAPLADIRTAVDLEPTAEFADGAIYRVVPRT